MKTTNELNAYQITWAIFIPTKGKITKRDAKLINDFNYRDEVKEVSRHFAIKDKAVAFINNLSGKLSKPYTVTLITDKQFGMCNYKQTLLSVATTQQLAESILI